MPRNPASALNARCRVPHNQSMQAHPYGEHAVLIECDPDEVGGWAATAQLLAPAALDVVPGARTVLIDGVDVVATLGLLADATPAELKVAAHREVQLPTVYDGRHLDEVARLWNCTSEEVAKTHQSLVFEVAFCGFAPGFAYLTGLPADLEVPRLSTPLPRVPAGAVALAGRYTGVYPTASPGGWQLIGRTDAVLWDLAQDPPALLRPGTTVRFSDG